MAVVQVAENQETVAMTMKLLERLFASHADRFRIRLWHGSNWPDENLKAATVVPNHPGALRAMLLPGTEMALAEAFLYNDSMSRAIS